MERLEKSEIVSYVKSLFHLGVFTETPKPDREPDFVSNAGSEYWMNYNTEKRKYELIRSSKWWGNAASNYFIIETEKKPAHVGRYECWDHQVIFNEAVCGIIEKNSMIGANYSICKCSNSILAVEYVHEDKNGGTEYVTNELRIYDVDCDCGKSSLIDVGYHFYKQCSNVPTYIFPDVFIAASKYLAVFKKLELKTIK